MVLRTRKREREGGDGMLPSPRRLTARVTTRKSVSIHILSWIQEKESRMERHQRPHIYRSEPNLHSRRAESIFRTVFGLSCNLPQIPGELLVFSLTFWFSPRGGNPPAHKGMDMDICYCGSATPGNSTLINFTFSYTLFLLSNVRFLFFLPLPPQRVLMC